MKQFFILTLFLAFLFLIETTEAQEITPGDSAVTLSTYPLDNQVSWALTKHQPDTVGNIKLVSSETDQAEMYFEIVNESSLFTTQTRPPQSSGEFEFKARHNKTGLFYLYAQTSDNGGQLLFSIQFTQDKGILLEQADKQITLLTNYNANQWYLFSIDFDNALGTTGIFSIQVDGTSYGEHEYVRSESDTFDFAQVTLGSESTGATAVSGFAEILAPITLDIATTTESATTTASEALLLLSITMSSTSISSDLDNGLIVTASLDGVPGVAITSATDTTTSTENATDATSATTTNNSTGVIDFVTDIISDIIEVFIPNEETAPTEEVPEVTPEPVATSTPTEAVVEIPTTEETSLPEPVEIETETPTEPETAVISNEPASQDETITTDF